MKPCTQNRAPTPVQLPCVLLPLEGFGATTSPLDREQVGEHAFCCLKHLQNKQPLVLLHHVNLRFSPSKWRWVRSIYVGQGGIKRDFEQFLLRYASLELDHWLRLWIPHSHRFEKPANEYASEITWYLHVPIARKSCEAMRDVFLSWQNPCLLDLGRLLADSLEMFLTLLLAQSFAVKNFLFICFFWACNPNPEGNRRNISPTSSKLQLLRPIKQDEYNPRNRAWTSRKCSSACSFVSSSWHRNPKDHPSSKSLPLLFVLMALLSIWSKISWISFRRAVSFSAYSTSISTRPKVCNGYQTDNTCSVTIL